MPLEMIDGRAVYTIPDGFVPPEPWDTPFPLWFNPTLYRPLVTEALSARLHFREEATYSYGARVYVYRRVDDRFRFVPEQGTAAPVTMFQSQGPQRTVATCPR